MAWPMVWPKLSSARSPFVSNSSFSTMRALIRDALLDDLVEVRVLRRYALHHARKQRCIADCAVLDHLGYPGRELARRQRRKRIEVRHHQLRLMKRADEVFALGQIHARLAADRAIHHRQQRRRYLHESDAAQVRRRDEACEVADNPAAKSDNSPRTRYPSLAREQREGGLLVQSDLLDSPGGTKITSGISFAATFAATLPTTTSERVFCSSSSKLSKKSNKRLAATPAPYSMAPTVSSVTMASGNLNPAR